MTWKLRTYLREKKLSMAQVASEMGPPEKKRSNETVLSRFKDGEEVESTVKTLETLVLAIERLTGERPAFEDLMSFE